MTTTAPLTLTDAERAYLSANRLGRLATVTSDGSPTVVPLGFGVQGDLIVITGYEITNSAKWKNLGRDERFAFVVDDGIGPTAKGVLLRGRAELDPRGAIVLRPDHVVTWGIESHPYTRLTRRAATTQPDASR